MNKEQLMALGLTEEQADKVIAELDKAHMVPKSRLDDKIQEVKDLQDQIDQRDKDLKTLKKDAEGNEDLQKKYDNLQKQYKEDKTSFESKIKETQMNSALKLALNGKVHDSDYAISQLDKEKIELDDDGNVTKGLDEQITSLQESKSFLFVEKQEERPPAFKGFSPPESKGDKKDTPSSLGANFAKQANQSGKQDDGNTIWG